MSTRLPVARSRAVLFLFTLVLAGPAAAVEKASEEVSPFMGSFAYAVPIEVPAFRGLEPRLGLAYSSEGRNGFIGVGWTLAGFGTVERTNAGGGTPRFDASDLFVLGGGKLLPCAAGIVSPSCTTGGTHTTEAESFTRVRFDAAANTWTVWGKNGVRTLFTSLLSAAGGTYRWGQTSVIDPLGNTVNLAWSCPNECYPASVSFGPYVVTLYREPRPDVLTSARGADLGVMDERLRSVIVSMTGEGPIRGYRLTYDTSAVTGRSRLVAVQQYGRDLTHDGAGLITGGSTLPPQTFTSTDDALAQSFVPTAPAPPTPAGSNEPVTWAEREHTAPTGYGNSLQKVDGVNGEWDARGSSTRALASGDGSLEVIAGAEPGKRFGLSRKVKDFSPDEIDFSFLESNGPGQHLVYAYEKGTAYGPWPANPGDTLRIEISGSDVLFKVAGATVHTLPSRRITYPLVAAASLASANAVVHSAVLSGALQDSASWCWGESLLTGDFDGDGRTDQACYTHFNQTLRVARSTGTSFASASVWRTGSDFRQAVGGDFNNDGKTDFALYAPWGGDFHVTLSTGTSFGDPALWGHAFGVGPDGFPTTCNTPAAALGAGDFNGDGRLDVSCRRADSTWPLAPSPIFIGLSTGTSFTFSVWNSLGCDAPAYQRTGSIDFDGDGKDDWYCLSSGGRLDVYVSDGTTFNWAQFGSPGPNFCGSRYVFGDFNADGRTDVACAENGKVALSTGRTFAVQGAWGAWCAVVPTEDPISTQVFAADVDGDGASEIVCNNAQAGANDIDVRRWTGTALAAPQVWLSNWCEGLLRPGDFDGDGKSDLLCDHLGTPVASAGTPGARVDLLSRVVTSLGGALDVTYAPSTQFPNDNNPGARPVVTALARDDGRGGVSTSTYAYAGARIDRERRRFLGFRHVRDTRPCLAHEMDCPFGELWLRQDPFVPGLPERVDVRVGGGALLSSRRYEYTPSPSTPPYLSLLSGEWSYAYDAANPAVFKRAHSTYVYDSWGNQVEVVDHGDADTSGDEATSVQTYAVNAAAFLTGLPSSRALHAGVGASGTLLSRVQYAYDGAAVGSAPTVGLATREEAWLDTTGAHVVTAARTFDAWGNTISTTDVNGGTTSSTFDTAQRLFPVTTTNAAGDTTSTVWNVACGAPYEITDANGQVTTTTHDAFCRPLRTQGPLGSFEEISYKDVGLPGSQRRQVETPSPVPGAGASVALEYLDGFGRAWRAVEPGPTAGQDIVSERSYDARGGLASRTPAYFSTETTPTPAHFEYDALGRMTRALLVDGEQASATYGAGREARTDPLGRTLVTTFDPRGRTATVEQDDGQGRTLVTRHGHDLRGDLTRFEDAAGNVWTWTYDSLGRLLSRSDPDSGTWTFAYDLAARKTTQTDAKGQTTEEWRDAAGRVTQRRTTDDVGRVETVTFAYGEPRAGFFNTGRLTSMTDPHGSARYDYDALGRQVRLRRTLDGVEYELTQRFDAAGRLLGTTFPDGDSFGTPMAPLQYDAAGQLVTAPGIVNDLLFDAAGRPRSATFANGATTTWDYHPRGWTTNVRTTFGTTTLQDLTYTFDPAGQTAAVTSPDPARSWTYDYDPLGRLVTADSPLAALDQTFAYDAVGNVTFNSRVGIFTYPQAPAPRPHAPLTIDGQALTYDANGNLVSGRGRSLQWSATNKPVEIDGTRYVYDGNGERLKKMTASATTLYPVSGTFEVTNGVATKYAALPGLGLVAKRVGATPYWLHSDRLGSLQAITDATGAPVQSTTYRPYGEKIAEATAHEESRGYIGEIQDDDTGLAYLNARYYDPEVGLFLSPDVLSPAEPGVGPNRYAYTAGNPIDFMDPSGMAANQLCGTQFGDREDCQDGSGFYFVLGGGIDFSDGGTGNKALDENQALAARFFATQPVRQPLGDGTTLIAQADRDGNVIITIIDASGQVLSSSMSTSFSEQWGGCQGGAGVRCSTSGTVTGTPLTTSTGFDADHGAPAHTSVVAPDRAPTRSNCQSFASRFDDNFMMTNSTLPGLMLPTGAGFVTGRAFAQSTGSVTLGQGVGVWIAGSANGTIGAGSTALLLEGASTAAWHFVAVGLAFEAGVAIGSAAEAAIHQVTCD